MDKITKMTYINLEGLMEVDNWDLFKIEMENQGFEVRKIEAKSSDNHPNGFCQVEISKGDMMFSYRGLCLTRNHIFNMVDRYNEHQRATYIDERDILRVVEILKRPEIKQVLKEALK